MLTVHISGIAGAPAQAAAACQPVAKILVDSAAAAARLTTAAACEGVTVTATWKGTVAIVEPIVVGAGTHLTISGAPVGSAATAIIDGQLKTQLLYVRGGARVQLEDLTLWRGVQVNVDDFGGAVHVGDGGKLWADSCEFRSNEGIVGGAVANFGDAFFTSCNFTGNRASGDKGFAIQYGSHVFGYALGGAVANFGITTYISCNFKGNSASGGRVIANFHTSSVASSSSSLSENVLGECGGAIYNEGVVTVRASSFIDNTATESGGAILNANLVTCKSSSFIDNTAEGAGRGFGGGAVTNTNSGTFESTLSNFTGNLGIGTYGGGAVYNDGHCTFNSMSSRFTNNTSNLRADAASLTTSTAAAFPGGGAIYNYGALNCTDSRFTGNQADTGGGGAIYNDLLSNLTCIGSTFTDNIAEGDGGAIDNLGRMICHDSEFVTNVAAAGDGGAIHNIQAGNVMCTSSRFISNTAKGGGTAGSGGAVYTAGNFTGGALVFVDNSAVTSGGAMYLDDTARGYVSNCNFSDNFSVYGGAILVTQLLQDASFNVRTSTFIRNNATSGAGGAILQQGEGTKLGLALDSASDFTDNAAHCCYAGGQGTGGSVSCIDASTGYGTGWSCCTAGQYIGLGVATADENQPLTAHQCVSCDDTKLDCSAVGVTVATLPLKPGFWREDNTLQTQDFIRACWNPHACNGTQSANGTDSELSLASSASWSSDCYCTAGYEGPYCAVCSDGYAALPGYRCVECTGGATAAAYTVIAVVAAVVLLLAWALFSQVAGIEDGVSGVQATGGALTALKVARLGLLLVRRLRIPIIVLQMLTQFISITGLSLPPDYLKFLRAMDVLTLDMRWLTSPGCALSIGFYQKLLISTLAPLAVVALIFTPRLCVSATRRGRRACGSAKLQRVVAKDFNAFLVFTFLIFSGVSLTIFETFACDFLRYDGPDGTSYLRADYSVQCFTPEHTAYRIYAAIMILVYPFGIPAMYCLVLRRCAVEKGERRAESSRFATSASFLWRPYNKDGLAFYWESIECVRRLLLTGLLVFIDAGTAGQSAFACVFAFLSGVVYEQVRPHESGADRSLYTLGYSIVFISMFTSLLLQVTFKDVQSQQVVGILLIALNVILLALALAQVFLVYSSVAAADLPLRRNSTLPLSAISDSCPQLEEDREQVAGEQGDQAVDDDVKRAPVM